LEIVSFSTATAFVIYVFAADATTDVSHQRFFCLIGFFISLMLQVE
jgi:hypothetical protein